MAKFLVLMGWQFLVIWGVLNAAFALQVIEKVSLPITNVGQCTALQLPIQEGRCMFIARAEGNYDRSWTFSAIDKPTAVVRHPDLVPMMYDATDWRLQGGIFAGVGLAVLAALLCLGPIAVRWRRQTLKEART